MTDTTVPFESVVAWQVRRFVVDAIGVMAMVGLPDEVPAEPMEKDAEWVIAALNGDDGAFGRIVEWHQRTIADQMGRFSRDQTTIEELVHDVFVEAYVSLGSYRADAPLIHWLRKIAVRVGYRYWKRQSRKQVSIVPLPEIEEHLDRQFRREGESRRDASETLGGLLDALSARDRLVLTLLYWDGCSVAEAAEQAGWSQTMVKVQAYRARQRLRKLIEESLK